MRTVPSKTSFLIASALATLAATGHGTAVYPSSRVYDVYQSNPENPSFQLARNAVAMDGTLSYYTWNQISQNISDAVAAGLPAGFDYSQWVPDGHIASGGRFTGNVTGLMYEGLDQVSPDWPTTPVSAGENVVVDYYATAPHEPSVWDVWMTTPDWDASTALNWAQMEFLGRVNPVLDAGHYTFDLTIPQDREGHHVLWIAWQRDDPVGEVFFSASDLMIEGSGGCNAADLAEPFGVLDLNDANAFVAGFLAGDSVSDLDQSGTWDLADIALFVAAFQAGCL